MSEVEIGTYEGFEYHIVFDSYYSGYQVKFMGAWYNWPTHTPEHSDLQEAHRLAHIVINEYLNE